MKGEKKKKKNLWGGDYSQRANPLPPVQKESESRRSKDLGSIG